MNEKLAGYLNSLHKCQVLQQVQSSFLWLLTTNKKNCMKNIYSRIFQNLLEKQFLSTNIALADDLQVYSWGKNVDILEDLRRIYLKFRNNIFEKFSCRRFYGAWATRREQLHKLTRHVIESWNRINNPIHMKFCNTVHCFAFSISWNMFYFNFSFEIGRFAVANKL